MPIIISRKDAGTTNVIDKSNFEQEIELQHYIHHHPEAIPIYYIHQDKRLLVVAREFDTPSGPIDALAIDKDGDIYIIETKLYANSDKRKVVAQALDYGASLWKNFADFANFIQVLDEHTQFQWQMSFRAKVMSCLGLDDGQIEAMIASMRENLNQGNLKFVVLMDSMDTRLKDLISYVNQKSHFDIYGVELELYRHEDYEIVIPKLYGMESRKEDRPPSKHLLTEEELKEQILAKNGPGIMGLAEGLMRQLKSMDLRTQAFPSQISYCTEVGGDLIPLLSLTRSNIWFSLPSRVIRVIGENGLLECKQKINDAVTFFCPEDLRDPAKISAGPRYEVLKDRLEPFVEAVRGIVGRVRNAMGSDA